MTRTYRINVPFQHDMGSIAPFDATESNMESVRENALWHINSMRRHDGLPELYRLPAGVKIERKL